MNALTQSAARSTLPSLEPRDMGEVIQLSRVLADSDMVPSAYRNKPGNIISAILWGRELGLAPMQSLQNIAVIGGRAAVWGDAVPALCRASAAFVSHREGVRGEGEDMEGWCEYTRAGAEPVMRTFSVTDARRAKLWDKEGPWRNYPQRMLMMRARSWSARDCFPDVMRGIYTVEEARDIPPDGEREMRDVPNLAERGPVTGRAGGMAETAAAATGRTFHAEPEADPPPAEEELPLVYLDGRLVGIRRGKKSGASAVVLWRHAALRQIADAPDRDKLRAWRQDNAETFRSLAEIYPGDVAAIVDAADARLAELRPAAPPPGPPTAREPGEDDAEEERGEAAAAS